MPFNPFKKASDALSGKDGDKKKKPAPKPKPQDSLTKGGTSRQAAIRAAERARSQKNARSSTKKGRTR